MTAIGFNWAFLFDEKFVDGSDIAAEIGKESGGWYESAQESVVVNGKWKAIPFGNIGQLMNWRTDWFKQAGYDKFPDTWDELLEAGIKLRSGQSVFFESGPRFGDNHGWLIRAVVLRRPRGRADGRHRHRSAETARAIEYAQVIQGTMREDCLGCTDVSNKQGFLSERSPAPICRSILWSARRTSPHGRCRPVEESKGARALSHVNPLPSVLPPKDQGGQGLPALADGPRRRRPGTMR